MNIKTPKALPMPEMGYLGDDASYGYDHADMAEQLSARDQQWIEMVRPVVQALQKMVDADDEAIKDLSEFGDIDPEMLALTNEARAALSQIKGE